MTRFNSRAMKFAVKKVVSGSSSARVGVMTFNSAPDLQVQGTGDSKNGTQSELNYETPLCLQYTRHGVIPHLVWELSDHLQDHHCPLLVSLSNTVEMKEAVSRTGRGLASFAKISEPRPLFFTVQDPMVATRTGYNDKSGVSVWTQGGRMQVTTSSYAEIVDIFQPQVYQALCDSDTPAETSRKRINYSVSRSLKYLDETLEKHRKSPTMKKHETSIFGTIEGGYDSKARLISAKETALRPVAGFILDGFHSNGLEIEAEFDMERVRPILVETVKLLPQDKPKALFGALSPEIILQLIRCGVDIFDSSYPTFLAEEGTALIINVDEKSLKTSSSLLELSSVEFKEDFTVIREGCKCYSCSRNFTRAYLNHLLNTKEMLAQVLLMLHNLYAFNQWFKQIRDSMSKDEFVMSTSHETK